MRKSLTICLILVAAMMVGCQTQSWKGTSYEPGAGRDADTPWCVHSGLFEVGVSASGGFLVDQDETFGSDVTAYDFEAMTVRGQVFLGYMINDFFEIGAFAEYASENWDPDDENFKDVDVTGFAVGPRLIYNFSNVTTDIVPFFELSGGYGSVTYENVMGINDVDADRMFGQFGVGLRWFGWDNIAFSIEAYYRYVSDNLDDKLGSETIDTTLNGNEGGVVIGVSLFF